MTPERPGIPAVNSWRIAGPYFESCNCDAICPCRRVNGQAGNGVDLCQFALAWSVKDGYFDDLDLAGRQMVMVGSWDYDGSGWPWQVGVFVDGQASDPQREVLSGILTGRYGGTPSRQYGRAIAEVLFVESADITIDHTKNHQSIKVVGHVEARERERYRTDSKVTCGIPGHDRDGYEVVMKSLEVHASKLAFSYSGNCGYSSSFDYRSEEQAGRRRFAFRRKTPTDP